MKRTVEQKKAPEVWKNVSQKSDFMIDSFSVLFILLSSDLAIFWRNFCPLNKKLWGPLESTLINFKAGSRKLSERKRSYFILLVLCGKQVHNCLHVSFFIHECVLFDKVISPPYLQDKIVDVRKGRGKKFDTGEPCLLHWIQQKSSKLRNVKKTLSCWMWQKSSTMKSIHRHHDIYKRGQEK